MPLSPEKKVVKNDDQSASTHSQGKCFKRVSLPQRSLHYNPVGDPPVSRNAEGGTLGLLVQGFRRNQFAFKRSHTKLVIQEKKIRDKLENETKRKQRS